MKKKKDKYLEKKRIKQRAKEKEQKHKIDYSDSPIRHEKTHLNYPSDGSMELALIVSMMMRKSKNKMWNKPVNK